MCLVAQQSGFALAHSCPVFIWDIAAAHAIAARVGLTVQYLNGQPLTYRPLLTGQPAPAHLVTGHPATLAALSPTLVLLER
jgi:3'-phosphoadenosine 5'-phosphosulfate (PAPS) 3'-phosphatase